jgi:hypothetical protein
MGKIGGETHQRWRECHAAARSLRSREKFCLYQSHVSPLLYLTQVDCGITSQVQTPNDATACRNYPHRHLHDRVAWAQSNCAVSASQSPGAALASSLLYSAPERCAQKCLSSVLSYLILTRLQWGFTPWRMRILSSQATLSEMRKVGCFISICRRSLSVNVTGVCPVSYLRALDSHTRYYEPDQRYSTVI